VPRVREIVSASDRRMMFWSLVFVLTFPTIPFAIGAAFWWVAMGFTPT
jgi:hypothetical protein